MDLRTSDVNSVHFDIKNCLKARNITQTISSYQDMIDGYFTDVKPDVDILDTIGVEYTGRLTCTLVFGTLYQAMFLLQSNVELCPHVHSICKFYYWCYNPPIMHRWK